MKELYKYLTINSLFSSLSGILMLVATDWLNEIFSIKSEIVFPIIGGNLLIFALFVWFVANKQIQSRWMVTLISILDFLWVVGSAIIVVFQYFDLSRTGNLLIALVAAFIAFLGFKQIQNNRR